MIHTTISLIKFKRLQRRLGMKLYEIVGILESLWMTTSLNAPQGDIGKLSNEDIAAALEYPGNEDELISALVETGWLDKDETYRLLVHDWANHAPNFIKGALARRGENFATPGIQPQGCNPKDATLEVQPQGSHPLNLTKPNLTKPNLTKPKLERASEGQAGPDGATTFQSQGAYQQKSPARIYAEVTGEVLLEPQARWLYQKLGGDDPEVMERWRKVVEGSMGFTWGKGRLNACFDHFQRGEIPGGGQSQAKARVESGGEGAHYPDPFAGMSEAEIRAKHARFMRVREIGLAAVLAEEEAAEEGQKALEPP